MEKTALGKLLIGGHFIANEAEMLHIMKESTEKKETFLTTFVKTKKISFGTVAYFLATKFQIPFLDLAAFDTNLISQDIDVKIIEKYNILPIKRVSNGLVVAISDPTLQSQINEFKFKTSTPNLHLLIVEDDKLKSTITKLLNEKGVNFAKDIDMDMDDMEVLDEESVEEDSTDSDIEDAPVVKFIHSVLLEAVKLKVSDIHMEPYEKMYRIRFRLDGALYEYKRAPIALKEKIASRVKVISRLDISEKRVPQDGRFKMKITADRAIDFRVSTLPTIWGEKIVMRILDSSPAMLDLNKLGYDPDQKERLMDAVARPYGMVLVTGPTGSGKTVSLYSCISILNKEDVNICTAEDPAEINLPGINQVNMNDKAGLTFAATLKSFLRQDPDVILVGEIRDLETADIAIKAAQTGHMVLSTLHTNDAPKTITRLLNMGVKPFNIASSVILITAQRLARKLCHCKKEEEISADVLLESGFEVEHLDGYGSKWKTYKPVGCDDCSGKGYKGRVGIYQVMPVTEEIKKLIIAEGSDIDIALEAKKNGVLSLREAGLIKVRDGVTSLEEVLGTTNID